MFNVGDEVSYVEDGTVIECVIDKCSSIRHSSEKTFLVRINEPENKILHNTYFWSHMFPDVVLTKKEI